MISRRNLLQYFTYGTAVLLLPQGCVSSTVNASTIASPSTTPATSSDATDKMEGGETEEASPPLRVAFSGVPKQFNPALYSVLEEYQLGLAIFDGLVWVDETLIPQPLLAKSWETSRDLLQWTFQLQEGVLFHHGTPFTATDVVTTFQRLLDPNGGSTFRSVLRFIERVEAIDDYTVRFYLTTPNVELPLLLGAPQAAIVPHDQSPQQLATQPSGTGPFRLVEYTPRELVRLARNATYWGTEDSFVDALEYHYMSYSAQLEALRSNDIDLIAQLNTADIASLQQDSSLHIEITPSGGYQTIVMQATAPPFHDIRVRQALKYCADHEALRRMVLYGHGTTGNNTPIAAISPYWTELPQQTQSIEKAKALLAEAGYPRGLTLDLITSTSRPGMLELATTFSTMAAAAGIQINVVRVPADVYWSDYGGKTPFHVGNWGFRPSVDETFMAAYHSSSKSNESKWNSPLLDKLIDQARAEQEEPKRKDLYAEAQKILHDDGAVIVPYFNPVAIAMHKSVDGFILHPAGWLDFSTVRFDRT